MFRVPEIRFSGHQSSLAGTSQFTKDFSHHETNISTLGSYPHPHLLRAVSQRLAAQGDLLHPFHGRGASRSKATGWYQQSHYPVVRMEGAIWSVWGIHIPYEPMYVYISRLSLSLYIIYIYISYSIGSRLELLGVSQPSQRL